LIVAPRRTISDAINVLARWLKLLDAIFLNLQGEQCGKSRG